MSPNTLAWVYEQYDKPRDAITTSDLVYWEGYRAALECLMLTEFGERRSYTRREIIRFMDKHRPTQSGRTA